MNLFNIWLANERDMAKLEMIVKRRATKGTDSKQIWCTMKIDKMKELYSDEKVDLLIERKTKAGHFDEDPEFPDDKTERHFWMFKESRH